MEVSTYMGTNGETDSQFLSYYTDLYECLTSLTRADRKVHTHLLIARCEQRCRDGDSGGANGLQSTQAR
jgi:hypothetical protein